VYLVLQKAAVSLNSLTIMKWWTGRSMLHIRIGSQHLPLPYCHL